MAHVEPAFDKSLADLAPISAVYDETTKMVTVTMDASTMQSILVCASLHLYDSPYSPKPIDPKCDYVDVVRENNKDSQRWHWIMRDSVDYLTGQISKATSPRYGDDKVTGIQHTREFRKWNAERTVAEAATAEEELSKWFHDQNVRDYTINELNALISKLRQKKEPVQWETALRLLSSAINAVSASNSAKEHVQKAIRFLQGQK